MRFGTANFRAFAHRVTDISASSSALASIRDRSMPTVGRQTRDTPPMPKQNPRAGKLLLVARSFDSGGSLAANVLMGVGSTVKQRLSTA
jgi:hypothetical protein